MERAEYQRKQAEREAKEERRELALDNILNVIELFALGKAQLEVQSTFEGVKTYRIVQTPSDHEIGANG